MRNFLLNLLCDENKEKELAGKVAELERKLTEKKDALVVSKIAQNSLKEELANEKEKSKALYEQLSESSREIKEKERIISEKDLLLRKRNSAIGSYKGTVNRLRTVIEELKKKKA